MPETDFNGGRTQTSAISSEERLALENIYLGDGISESSVSDTILSKKSKVFRQKRCGVPAGAPKNRDAMGNYIPPPGGKPLSEQEVKPGPQYEPDYTVVMTQYPQYTLGGQDVKRPIFLPRGGLPGPGKYNISGDLKWGDCRRTTLKSKIPTKDDTPGPGPASTVIVQPTGRKYTMCVKTVSASCTFNKNPHVMPLESSTPSGNLCHSDAHWLTRPRTLGRKHKEDDLVPGPGPGKYNTDRRDGGKGFSMGIAAREPGPKEGPGPGKYKLRTTMGKGLKAPMGVKHDRRFLPRDIIPGPDVYHRAGFRLDEPGYTMKYRWMDADPPKAPGPSDYNASSAARGPEFTIKKKAKEISTDTPGPSDYEPSSSNWTKPGKSFGVTWKDMSRKPATKDPEYPNPDLANVLLPSVPAYSFRKSESVKKVRKTPAPNSYTPKLPESKKTITIAKRFESKPMYDHSPGPAQPPCIPESKVIYDPTCPRLMGTRATTLKSRHTPLKYTGQRNSGMLEPASREIECNPLIS